MNFITFPVNTTNIFPAANSTSGSQLLTEWNLRSRETVMTDPNVLYEIGMSYTHGLDDFEVSMLQDDSGNDINSYTLKISEGRALINGHYVENVAPMTIDLVEANAELAAQSKSILKGQLAIGIRAYYATDETVAGTILVENEDEMYLGVQLVILPKDEFLTPENVPNDASKMTAHLLLATFNFANNKVTSLVQNTNKIKCIPAKRVQSLDEAVSSSYIRKNGLNSKKIYAFAGKGTNPTTGFDTWEDVTDSTMVWDANPSRTSNKTSYTEAQFVQSAQDVYMVVPHKQVEGMTDESGNAEYYEPKVLALPQADYTSNTPGIVGKSYTSQVKRLANQINNFRTTLTGKQVLFLEEKNTDTTLPTINKTFNEGDYVLVGTDYTAGQSSDGVKDPSTMYVVLPGLIKSITYKTAVANSDEIPDSITGTELGLLEWSEENRQSEPDTSDPDYYPEFYSEEDEVRGVVDKDYFRVKYTYKDHTYKNFYYTVSESGVREWSSYVLVTGEIPLATESSVGGFLNVSTDNTDYGYVYLDDSGRLRLVDYALLRSGTLAYQFAEDLTLPSGITSSEVQTYLDEYVNQRIAFGDATQLATDHPNVIHLYISLTEEESATTINISDIDSRFNTAVCLHIQGTATSTTTINIYDCQKLMIDSVIEGTPIINVYRTCLYYDSRVFDYIRSCARDTTSSSFTGFEGISIWYTQYEDTDPNLLVDNMTVSELDSAIVPDEIEFWKESGASANDNHYLVALKSITFAPNGDIVQCGLLVSNQSTDNVDPGEKIVAGTFTLPNGSGLIYPKSCLVNQLKVTGTFVSAYKSQSNWYIADTNFSALTDKYDQYSQTQTASGSIAYHTKTTVIESTLSQESIPAWDVDTYHLFYGGSLS